MYELKGRGQMLPLPFKYKEGINIMVVRDDNVFRSEYNKGEGYVIRLKAHTGLKVVITENMLISYSSSYKIYLSAKEWGVLQQEIQNGFTYMSKNPASNVPDVKPRSIPKSKIKPLTLYEDKNGRGVFVVGRATMKVNNTCGASINRYGCPFIIGIVKDIKIIRNIQMTNVGLNIDIIKDFTFNSAVFSFDTYTDLTKGLVREVWSCKTSCFSISINGCLAVAFDLYGI